ncbi:MAG: ATP-binding cassette domain-containing protein [Desulfobulbaceae bacterium]|nr:ATP-binding cassette domain-containing protein [Desulfobulbaceae bacterium]
MIEISGLRFAHGGGPPVFDGFSCSLRRGETWTVIGPSGCGKTTLLYLIAGLNHPQGGKIRVGGQPLSRPRPATGLVLQDHGLLPWATVLDNTCLGLKIRRFYGPDGRHSPDNHLSDQKREEERVRYWLNWLKIDHLAAMYPAQLSRGQRQRAAIARTLVMEPDLLLMDEPFSALDAPIREDLQNVMKTFHGQSGLTLFTVTHDIEEAVTLGEKILILSASVNTEATIVDNQQFHNGTSRQSPAFLERCVQLKELLSDQAGRR